MTIPTIWFNGAILLMLSTVGSGAWYMATQAAEIRSLKDLVIKEEAEAAAARRSYDEAMSGLRLALNGLGDRTTRTESQLLYLTDTIRSKIK